MTLACLGGVRYSLSFSNINSVCSKKMFQLVFSIIVGFLKMIIPPLFVLYGFQGRDFCSCLYRDGLLE